MLAAVEKEVVQCLLNLKKKYVGSYACWNDMFLIMYDCIAAHLRGGNGEGLYGGSRLLQLP